MTTLRHEQVSARLKQLPSLPSAVSELLASFSNEEVDVEHIARLIARDQGLTARVLRVANSSFYGLQSKVGTINEAVVILGFRAVRSMVMAVAMNGAFRVDHCPGFDAPAYLRHGVGVGLAARALAPLAKQNPELAFTGGLLHDIGQLVLASNFSAQYAVALAYRKQHDCPLVVAERDVLGLDHAEVGGLLAEAWRFPDSLHQAVAEHHAPATSLANSLANVVHLADSFAHALGLAGFTDELLMPVDRTAWERLDLDGEKCRKAFAEIERSFEETCLVLTS
jgi:putative nucleotidyltransferase with HDIG domain